MRKVLSEREYFISCQVYPASLSPSKPTTHHQLISSHKGVRAGQQDLRTLQATSVGVPQMFFYIFYLCPRS